MLVNIQEHLHKNGLNERIHKNTGRIPKTDSRIFIDSNITFSLKQFLTQYSNIHGLPSPLRHKNDSGTFIYLPTDKNIKSIYNEYKDYYYNEHDKNKQVISYYTFRKLWKEIMPNLKFQSPENNLCETCEEFKSKMQVIKNDADEYKKLKTEFENHKILAQNERQHYINNVNKSGSNLSVAYICYD